VARPTPRQLLSFALILVIVAAGAYRFRAQWLPWMADPLIYNDGAAHAEIAVTLAGDTHGSRVDTAAFLVANGYAPAVLVSGPAMFGAHECDFAINQAVAEGFPRDWFIPLPHTALSTWEEAHVILAELHRRQIRRFLLVTNDYHSARARRLFLRAEREMGGGPEMIMVTAPNEHFTRDGWWNEREARKIWFEEWLKTVASYLRM
jgi:uncharacterized SAM-binding protein YcdF (DUF218 family)